MGKCLTPVLWTRIDVRAATVLRLKISSKKSRHTLLFLSFSFLYNPVFTCNVFVDAVTPVMTCGRRTAGEAGRSRALTPLSSVRGRASHKRCRSRRMKAARFTASWRSTRYSELRRVKMLLKEQPCLYLEDIQ